MMAGSHDASGAELLPAVRGAVTPAGRLEDGFGDDVSGEAVALADSDSGFAGCTVGVRHSFLRRVPPPMKAPRLAHAD